MGLWVSFRRACSTTALPLFPPYNIFKEFEELKYLVFGYSQRVESGRTEIMSLLENRLQRASKEKKIRNLSEKYLRKKFLWKANAIALIQ